VYCCVLVIRPQAYTPAHCGRLLCGSILKPHVYALITYRYALRQEKPVTCALYYPHGCSGLVAAIAAVFEFRFAPQRTVFPGAGVATKGPQLPRAVPHPCGAAKRGAAVRAGLCVGHDGYRARAMMGRCVWVCFAFGSATAFGWYLAAPWHAQAGLLQMWSVWGMSARRQQPCPDGQQSLHLPRMPVV
jgi:hypothetical protein